MGAKLSCTNCCATVEHRLSWYLLSGAPLIRAVEKWQFNTKVTLRFEGELLIYSLFKNMKFYFFIIIFFISTVDSSEGKKEKDIFRTVKQTNILLW